MHKIALVIFLAVGGCASTFASAAITSPYSNDFNSNDPASVVDFSRTVNDQWSLVGGNFRNEILASSAPDKSSSSILRYIGLGGTPSSAQDFLLNSTFKITNSDGNYNSLGFAVLGNSTDATAAASRFYLADVYVGGGAMNAQLRFAEVGPTIPNMLPMTTLDFGKKLVEDVVYSLQLQGLYDDFGNLTLNLKLTGDNTSKTYQIDPIAAGNVLTGEYFGLRNRASGTPDQLTVEFDSLNIAAVPEPSSIGFVATSLIAGYAIGRYMRRKFAQPAN